MASTPAPGEILDASPEEIRLTYNEPVATTSTILLFSNGFQQVDGLEMVSEPQNPEQVVATLPPLDAGSYTVEWTALSPDGHTVRGSYSFTIQAPSVTAGLLLRVGGVAVLLLGVAAVWFARRQRPR